MTTRRQCERSADISNRRTRGAKAVQFSRAVRRRPRAINLVFIRVAKARTCPRDTSLSADGNLARRQRDYLNRYFASINLQVCLRTAREFAADLRKRLSKGGSRDESGVG